jgi:hypothetical protein
VLVQGVEPAAGPPFGGGELLVLPPAVDEAQRGEATQRAVDGDLRDPQTVRHLEPIELRGSFLVDAESLEEHLGVELEHESSSRPGHVRLPEIVAASPPRNR